MNAKFCRKLVLILLAISFAINTYSQSRKPLSVCDVLSSLDSYIGKVIEVRGVFFWTRHGWTLSEEFDFEPCPSVESTGKQWPGTISLSSSASESTRLVNLLQGPHRVVQEHLSKETDRLAIVATFTGELDSKDDLRIVRNQDGSYSGNGYGQDYQYPALLLVKDVKDIKLVPWK